MDVLFQQLLTEIEHFLKISKKASMYLTRSAIEKNQPHSSRLNGWNEMIEDTQNSRDRLCFYLSDNFEKHIEKINIELYTFRQLSRYVAEVDCDWSIYHQEVHAQLKKIHILLIDIDTKYKLGQHKNDP